MAERYDYRAAVLNDVVDYIHDNIDLSEYDSLDDLEQELNETLLNEDTVTGNASGSYTFSTWEAEENICHNLDLLADAQNEYGADLLEDGAEACDVAIRCYVLAGAVTAAMWEIEDEFNAAHESEEEPDDEEDMEDEADDDEAEL